MTTKETLKNLLKQNVVDLTFTKVDGTKRNMKCTLKENLLPGQVAEKLSPRKQENDNVLPVWDLEKESFRSFRIDSLTEYQIV